ncbi:MAG TPA: prepilin peptidase [Acidimicrobiales bacterium]|nr:prepilin peptidase [Acidimicrobiales bacterium]
METLLIAGSSVAGLVIGAVLDPIGQQLADRSRAADDRRHEEERAGERAPPRPAETAKTAETAECADTDTDTGDAESVAGQPEAAGAPSPGHDVPSGADEQHTEGRARNLLPSGRSPGRRVGSAIVTGGLFGAAADHFGADLVLAPFCVFFAMLVAVSVTDLSHRLVPRHLLYPALALIVPLLAATSAVDHGWHSLVGSAIAGAVAFGIFFLIWWFIPRGMGFGDVRLAGVIGLTVGYLSLLHAYVAFLAGFVVGMVFGVVMMVVSSTGRKTRIPFAPSLAVGAVIAVFWGGHLAQSLFHGGS